MECTRVPRNKAFRILKIYFGKQSSQPGFLPALFGQIVFFTNPDFYLQLVQQVLWCTLSVCQASLFGGTLKAIFQQQVIKHQTINLYYPSINQKQIE